MLGPENAPEAQEKWRRVKMTDYNFCTYFDSRYLTRGLALYRSLEQWCPNFTLWILCLDSACHQALTRAKISQARIISLPELQNFDREFAEAKNNRSPIEYYFTATPVLLSYVLNKISPGDLVTYLDADLFFFNSPALLLESLVESSCGLIEHRFSENLEFLRCHGIYNVGWVSLRNDKVGLACAGWWRRCCLEWCHDRVEDGRFADQKYLDIVPQIFPRVQILDYPGANLAPWNLGRHCVSASSGGILADEQPVVFFHFHGLRQIARRLYSANFGKYLHKPNDVVIRQIYCPYIRALTREEEPIAQSIREWRRSSPGRGRGTLSVLEIAAPSFAREILRGRHVIFFRAAPLRWRSKAAVFRKPEHGFLDLDPRKAETAAATTHPDNQPGSRLRSTARS
jgi:hypothetical protein